MINRNDQSMLSQIRAAHAPMPCLPGRLTASLGRPLTVLDRLALGLHYGLPTTSSERNLEDAINRTNNSMRAGR